ncbi:MAG: hypothetical protein ABI972_13465 [Acidobacteriota bacterium]
MRLAALRRGVSLASVVWVPLALLAQSSELWKQGNWALQSPPPGNCGSLPLLQVKGPGSVFDPPNSAVLADLEKALPEALAKACPGTREVVLVSGRSRRLVRVQRAAAPAPAAPPAQSAPAPAPPQVREAAPPPEPVVTRRESPPASNQLAPLQPSEVVSGGTPAPPPVISSGPPARTVAVPSSTHAPTLGARSELPSLASVHKTEDKCEVLLKWLESGKSGDPAPTAYRMAMRPDMQRIFRDEPMNAVFGTTYDATENRWRLEMHEKAFGPCIGMVQPRANVPFAPRGPNQTLLQYAQQFQQYRQVIDGAFLGQPGPFEPAALSRYVQQARSQLALANQTMIAAGAARPDRQTFDQLNAQRQAVPAQLSLLTATEKSQVTEFLSQRLAAISSPIADEWLRGASSTQKGAASAKVLNSQFASITPVLTAMDAPARTAFQDRYNHLIESLIAEPLQSDIAKLQSVQPTLSGVLEIAGWKTTFDASYRDLRSFAAVRAAEHEYTQNRARVLTGALPAWIKQVDTIPVDGAAITAKRRDMEILFPTQEDRSSPVFSQYETPLRAKEDQLRLRVEAELRKQQQEAEAAALRNQQAAPQAPGGQAVQPAPSAPKGQLARAGAGGPITAASFTAAGLNHQDILTNIFTGDFDKIELKSDDLSFADTFGQFLTAFGRQCDRYLPQDRKVEMTVQVCTSRWVNGYGADRGCANWETQGTGVYADPELYAVKQKLDMQAAMDAPKTVLKMLTQKDPLSGMMNMAGEAMASSADMTSLVAKNGCASPGLKRFEENFTRFALNKQPIRLGESGPKLSPIDPLPGIPFRDQNYTRLMEDLISDQARSWAMNRYRAGSVSGVSVSTRDAKGRPAKIVANYTFDGFNGRSQGSVALTFGDGQPECMYFHDFPATCRTPNRRIVSSYENGGYQLQ